jgi:hypothetical protein
MSDLFFSYQFVVLPASICPLHKLLPSKTNTEPISQKCNVCNAKNSFFQKFVELSILAGESGVQGLPPLPEREVSSHHSSSQIPRKDGDPFVIFPPPSRSDGTIMRLCHIGLVTGGDRKKAFFGEFLPKNVYSHFNFLV